MTILATLAILFVIWLPVEAFIWNNMWRGRADQARLYYEYAFLLHTIWVAFPILSAIIVLFNGGIWLALITLGVYIAITLIVSEWRYLVVFAQYKKMYIEELQEQGDLANFTEKQIDQFVKKWLFRNVKQS